MSPADLINAILKSGIVASCSMAAVLLSMVIIEFLSGGPIVRLISAGVTGAAGWWLGLVMTNHPLMVQIRFAAGRIGVFAGTAPRFPVLGAGHTMRSRENAVKRS